MGHGTVVDHSTLDLKIKGSNPHSGDGSDKSFVSLINLEFNVIFYMIELEESTCSLMRRNQLPVSAARWQYGSRICFATFI